MNQEKILHEQDGSLILRLFAFPANANHHGDVFGGWMLSQMDLAAYYVAQRYAECRTVTVAIQNVSFIAPAHVGDFVACYGKIEKVGNTSLQIKITVYAKGDTDQEERKVAEGLFIYVALDERGQPKTIAHVDREKIKGKRGKVKKGKIKI